MCVEIVNVYNSTCVTQTKTPPFSTEVPDPSEELKGSEITLDENEVPVRVLVLLWILDTEDSKKLEFIFWLIDLFIYFAHFYILRH